MIPVGYLAKHVSKPADWFKDVHIQDVYSVSSCISKPFTDYVAYWKHNGYWFFDSPQIIIGIAAELGIDLTGTKLFFYEVYELQFDDSSKQWKTFAPDPAFSTQVDLPAERTLEGYDIVTFQCGQAAECSPLSCNLLAAELETNEHCLLASFAQAKQWLDGGRLRNSEPGPFRIFAVYSVDWP